MTDSEVPRWLLVWKAVASCSIGLALILGFAIPEVGRDRPDGEATYPVKYRGGTTYYVTPAIGIIQSAALPVAFSLMASFALASYLVERRRQPSWERPTLEGIACRPFGALVTYLLGLCLCFALTLGVLTYRAAPILVGAWTIFWSSTVVVMWRRRRRRNRRLADREGAPRRS